MALDAYRQLVNADENFLICPYSLTATTAMLYLATSGETRQQLGLATRFADLPTKRLVSQARSASQLWASRGKGVTLHNRQEVQHTPNVTLKPAYLETLRATWGTTVQPLEPSDSTTAQVNLTGEVDFDGKWLTAFDATWTRDTEFHGLSGQRETVRTMRVESDFSYQELADLNTRAVSIPYRGGLLELVVLLPDATDGILALEQQLSPALLSRINPTTQAKVDLFLPRFDLNSHLELEGVLRHWGTVRLFQDDAEFDGMLANRPADASSIRTSGTQEASMSVTEEGTIAQAITRYEVRIFSDGHPTIQPVKFVVDHPFLVLLRDTRTRRLLFLGRVTHPGYTPADVAPQKRPTLMD